MKYLVQLVILVGFCLGTLGAAGFHSPRNSATDGRLAAMAAEGKTVDSSILEGKHEDRAPLYFGLGFALLLAGGLVQRFGLGGKSADAAGSQEGRRDLKSRLVGLHEELVQLSMNARDLTPVQMRDAITKLNEGPMYELTSEFERWTQLLGFEDYARIWAHVATGERLTNRAWSQYADGYPREAREELVLASMAFEEAMKEA